MRRYNTALIVAARLGALRAIQQLAALGADVNYENMHRHTVRRCRLKR